VAFSLGKRFWAKSKLTRDILMENKKNNNKTNLHLWAEYYAKNNRIVVPVKSLSKKPSMGDSWQDNTDNQKAITYLHENSNLGILLVDGYCDIDLDCPDAIALAPHFLPPTAMFGRVSAPESHWVYNLLFKENEADLKWYEKRVIPKTVMELGTVAEFRYNNGQTVHPPSIHGSGEAIVWYNGNDDPMSIVLEIDAGELKRCYLKLCAMVLLKHVIYRGHMHSATVMLVGALYHLGWDLDEATDFIEVLITACDMEDDEDRYKCLYDTYTKGDNDLSNIGGFNELASILDQGGIDGNSAVRYLRKCLEPTGLGERKPQTPADVFNKLSGKLGDLVEMPAQMNTDIDSTPPDGLGTDADDAVYEPDTQPPPGVKMLPELTEVDMSSADRDWLQPHNEPRVYYPLLNNLLPRNQVGFIFGESGAFKSYLVLDMVMNSIYRDDWAGHQIAGNKLSTLWVAGEGREETPDRIDAWLQDNTIDRGDARSNGDGANKGLRLYKDALELHEEVSYGEQSSMSHSSFDLFEEYLRRNRGSIDLVILDTFSSLFSGDDSNRSDVVRVLNRLQRISRREQMTFLIVHHKNKGGMTYRGSGAITADSDFNFDISHEYDLAENEKLTAESKKTGRIVFHNTQQKTQSSGSLVYFRPNIVPLDGFFSGFGEQVSQVVMEHQTGMEAMPRQPRAKAKPRSKAGVGSLRSTQIESHHIIQTLLKDDGCSEGILWDELYGKYETMMRDDNRPVNNKRNFFRSLDALLKAKVVDKYFDIKMDRHWLKRGELQYLEELSVDINATSPFDKICVKEDFLG
jgi:hypothetical protein